MSYEEDYWGDINYRDGKRRRRKLSAGAGIHVPNKKEAKVLRRLKAETGLSEEELRKEKKYRVELSDAQKVKPGKTECQKRALSILKGVTRELKLAKEHPLVIEEYKKRASNDSFLKNHLTESYSPYKNV